MRDAPYIEDAERNGMPHPEPVTCRICGAECQRVYISKLDNEPIGCNRCVLDFDADEWEGRE